MAPVSLKPGSSRLTLARSSARAAFDRLAGKQASDRKDLRGRRSSHLRPGSDANRVVESRWRDSDDGVCRSSVRVRESATDDRRASAKLRLPNAIAQHHRARAVVDYIRWAEQPADHRARAEHVEEVGCHERPADHARPAVVEQGVRVGTPVYDAGDVAHRSARGPNSREVAGQRRHFDARRSIGPEHRDSILVGDGETPNENRLKGREHRDRHADAERENREDGDDEGGRSAEAAKRESNVPPQSMHRRSGNGLDSGHQAGGLSTLSQSPWLCSFVAVPKSARRIERRRVKKLVTHLTARVRAQPYMLPLQRHFNRSRTMALWKEQAPPKKDATTMTPEPVLKKEPEMFADPHPCRPRAPRVARRCTTPVNR